MASLQEFLEHKEFIVCERAVQEFEQILSIVGGPGEKAKGAELLARCRRVCAGEGERRGGPADRPEV